MKPDTMYSEFLNSPEALPPAARTDQILATVRADLNPSVWRVFSKLGVIQLLVGALVLLFCPQFGISLFPGMGLMALFMRFGEAGCMVGCGSVFLGASGLIGSAVLRSEEIRVIRNSRVLQLSVMTLLSAGVFVCLSGERVLTLGLAWVLGGLLGGVLSFELGRVVRLKLAHSF
ncbi:hypothetical protein WDW37_19175 [Bdellovibrionota bacterium FG-1]